MALEYEETFYMQGFKNKSNISCVKWIWKYLEVATFGYDETCLLQTCSLLDGLYYLELLFSFLL